MFSHFWYNRHIEKVVKKLSKGQMNDMFKQMEDLFLQVDKLNKKITKMGNEHKVESKIKDQKIEKLTKENEKLKLEVERLKNQNKKDSSNSSRPSGTNGYKKVITNRREKSEKKQGGQEGHKGNSLGKERLEKILNNEKIKINKPVEINKNEKNKNLKPYKTTVIDINI